MTKRGNLIERVSEFSEAEKRRRLGEVYRLILEAGRRTLEEKAVASPTSLDGEIGPATTNAPAVPETCGGQSYEE